MGNELLFLAPSGSPGSVQNSITVIHKKNLVKPYLANVLWATAETCAHAFVTHFPTYFVQAASITLLFPASYRPPPARNITVWTNCQQQEKGRGADGAGENKRGKGGGGQAEKREKKTRRKESGEDKVRPRPEIPIISTRNLFQRVTLVRILRLLSLSLGETLGFAFRTGW